jgi:uncharacterized cupin superfamily protein
MANLFDPHFEDSSDRDGYSRKRAPLGRQAGSERLGASIFELPAGQANFPFHYHLANEEMLIVLAGRPTLRTSGGDRVVERGEVVAFPRGETGAHQVINRGDEPARILILSEMNAPEIVVRPESAKLSAFGRPPGARGEGMHKVFFERDSTPFWQGEEPPR